VRYSWTLSWRHSISIPKQLKLPSRRRRGAIIPVHIAGQPANMDALMEIAKKHKLIVIEDAAHAHAALFRDRPVGSIGHMGSFSFQSSKNSHEWRRRNYCHE